jgi:hypothetical protein
MYLRFLAMFLALGASISGVSGLPMSPDVVVSDSVTTAAGSVSYSITYMSPLFGAGSVVQMPTETITANDNVISVEVEGCTIRDASWIKGGLEAKSAHHDIATVSVDIKGPEASLTDYSMYGYVTPDLAWAGQWVDYAKGSSIKLEATGSAPIGPILTPPDFVELSPQWAGSILLTNDATSPVFTVDDLYQDAMAMRVDIPWAMSNIYSGTGAVKSSNSNDWIDVYTGRQFYVDAGANAWVNKDNFIHINSQSMAYVNPLMSYTNLDYSKEGAPGVYSYWYIDKAKGVNEKNNILY